MKKYLLCLLIISQSNILPGSDNKFETVAINVPPERRVFNAVENRPYDKCKLISIGILSIGGMCLIGYLSRFDTLRSDVNIFDLLYN